MSRFLEMQHEWKLLDFKNQSIQKSVKTEYTIARPPKDV